MRHIHHGILFFILLVSRAVIGQEMLVNGGFETPIGADNFTTNILPGWTISADVDVIRSWWQPAEGLQSIDIAGEVAGPEDFIEQHFPTVRGNFYTLSFSFSNNPDEAWARGRVTLTGHAEILALNLYHESAMGGDMKYTVVQESFVADSTNTMLRFTHIDSPKPVSRGIVLDGVSVVEAGNLIRNGSFEAPLPGGNTTAILPWWTVQNTVDVIGSYWQAADGERSLDLSGDNAPPGTSIAQTIVTVPGRQYVLSFWYANNADTSFAEAEVRLTGDQILLSQQISHSGSAHGSMNYTLFERSFVADTNRTTLTLTHLNSAEPLGRGIVLDAVEITPGAVLTIGLGATEGLLLTWNGEAKRFYQIESTTTLMTPNWQPITDWLQGQGRTIDLSVPLPRVPTASFYRLNLRR